MGKVIIASGPVIVENGKVLLVKHGDTNAWKFCGGKIENADASLAEAARREAYEEMGFMIEIIHPEPYLMHSVKVTTEGEIDVLLVHYLAKRLGEVKPDRDIREWGWLTIDELEGEELSPNILPSLHYFGFIK